MANEKQKFDPSASYAKAKFDPSASYGSSNQEGSRGLLTPGNIDLYNRPHVKNPNGKISTVRSMSFEENGKEILVPTVSEDGRILSEKDAIDQYHRTGKHLGIFDNPENATAFARNLHNEYETGKYDPPKPWYQQSWERLKAGFNAPAVGDPDASLSETDVLEGKNPFQKRIEIERNLQSKAGATANLAGIAQGFSGGQIGMPKANVRGLISDVATGAGNVSEAVKQGTSTMMRGADGKLRVVPREVARMTGAGVGGVVGSVGGPVTAGVGGTVGAASGPAILDALVPKREVPLGTAENPGWQVKLPGRIPKSQMAAKVAESPARIETVSQARAALDAATSEGRPATWTNERVIELAKQNNPRAIEQVRLRKLTFPNYKFITGEELPSSPTYRGGNRFAEANYAQQIEATQGVRDAVAKNLKATGTGGRSIVDRLKDTAYGLTNPNPEWTHGFARQASKISGSNISETVGALRGRGLNIPAGTEVNSSLASELTMIAEDLGGGKFTVGQRRILEPLAKRTFETPEQVYEAVTEARQKLGLKEGK